MYKKFENLTDEKRNRIIGICLEEFAQHGYKNASTNSIVTKAGISKGILFHYFGNKKNLYLYLLDYAIGCTMKAMLDKMADLPDDIFERIFSMGMLKLKVGYQYPMHYKFLLEAFTHIPAGLEKELNDRYEKIYKSSMPLFMKDIDTSKFREGMNKEKAIELIELALEAVSNKYIKKFKDKSSEEVMSQLENVTDEYKDYIDILKFGVYGS